MKKLAETEAAGRGFAKTLTCRRPGRKDLMALMFVDRGRKQFISIALTLRIAETACRPRRRMVDGVGSEKMVAKIGIPEAAAAYFSAASKIYQQKRCRQDNLGIEKAFEVKEWSMRVNSTLSGICAIDAWLLHKGTREARAKLDQNTFHTRVAEELIDKEFRGIGLCRRRSD